MKSQRQGVVPKHIFIYGSDKCEKYLQTIPCKIYFERKFLATSTIKEIHAKQPVIFEENGFKVVRIPFKEKVPKVISRRFRMYANFFTYLEIEYFSLAVCFSDSK